MSESTDLIREFCRARSRLENDAVLAQRVGRVLPGFARRFPVGAPRDVDDAAHAALRAAATTRR